MSGGIHEPSSMQTENNADKDTPQEEGDTAEGEENDTEAHHRNPVPIVEPDVERFLGKIWRILGHAFGVHVVGFAEKQPADMGPPGTIARRVRIAFLI